MEGEMGECLERKTETGEIAVTKAGGKSSKLLVRCDLLPPWAMHRIVQTDLRFDGDHRFPRVGDARSLCMEAATDLVAASMRFRAAENDASASEEAEEEGCNLLAFVFRELASTDGGVPAALLRVAGVMREGAEKYAVDNWRHVPTDVHLNHAIRHLLLMAAGATSTGEDHMAHALCRVAMALDVVLCDEDQ